MRLPTIEVEKPHCGHKARRSRAMNRLADFMRAVSSSTVSRRGDFVVTNPRATILSSGTSFNGSNDPDLSSSYSSNKRWARMPLNIGLAIRSYPPSVSHRLP
jgi:hypothetical protein